MKIVYIAETIGGGVRKHLDLLLENLNNKYELVVIHGPRVDDIFKENIKKYQEQGIKVYCLSTFQRKINLKQDILTYHSVSNILKKEKPDIVHCHSSKAGIIGRLAAKIHRVPKIFYTPHGYAFQANEFSNVKRHLFALLEGITSRIATTMTFTVSKGEKKLAINKHIDCADKFEVIYNGLPNRSFNRGKLRKLLNISDRAFIVGNCARISIEKNVDLFIKIAQKFLELHPESHFVWIGDGKGLDEYKKIHPHIHFIGFRDDSDELVADFDVFLTTSLHEGLPYAPIEAIRAEIPVVASDVAGNNEVVIPGVNGYLYPLDDIQKTVQTIEESVSINKKDIKKDFAKRFLLDNMIQKIEKYYLD